MDERWFIFDELSPEEALGMLAALPVSEESELPIKGVGIRLQRGPFGCHASLLFPDPHMDKDRPSKVELLNSMISFYKERKGREPAHEFGEQPRSELEKGLIGLVLNSLEDEEDPVPTVEDEVMVVCRGIPPHSAADQLHHIQLHASYAKIATVASKLTDECYYLFHVKNDKKRKSTLQSIIGTGILADAELLNCFEVGKHHVFLPEKHTFQSGDSIKDTPILPGAMALSDFCKILLLLQGGAGLALPDVPGSRLAAVCPVDSVEGPDGAKYDMLLLINTSWRSQYDPHLRPVGVEEYQVHELADSENARRSLKEAIAGVKSNAGYRLELRQMDHGGEVDREREKVKEQLVELEHRLEYLNGVRVPCPQLYRFTAPHQLQALAHWLRVIHVKSLEQGAISYGFQSNRDHPGGVHYLLVDTSRSVEAEGNPVPILEGIAGSPMRYQVDPLWARHYLQHSSETLVYVPDGCTLYPSMHDWEIEGSDDYLRAIMSHWFHGQSGVPEIPKKPIYIFDGETGPGRRINISVLDKESFAPIKQKLGWINDNLQIYESFEDFDGRVKQLASIAGRRQLFQVLEAESNEMIAKSSEVIEKACEDVIASVGSLVEGYNEEIPEFIELIENANKKINKQKRRVNELNKQKSDIERFLSETEQGIDAVGELTEQVKTEIALLRDRVATSISDSGKALREMEDNAGNKITLLEEKKKDLLERLKKAHRIFS